ncbi:MAG: PEP-CTERM sorting domain-containing protein [Gammaproteobacteria bacterium]|nr:PEP-CTERM sorting domain-containing protein [Gammaproteobacteria bacterium]MBU1481752.1 PEP-CTERM sorting domain-containing protein [Gammaproteobacteria bacterium]
MFRNLFALSAAAAVIGIIAVPTQANASVSVPSGGAFSYTQDFDSLAATGTANLWTNDSTLQGWSLFTSNGADIATYNSGTGSINTGNFYSFGNTNSTDRALGGVASGGAYFGSPSSGAVAGYIAVAFQNNSGSALSNFTVGFDGEQWRNGGNASTQPMVLEYGYGSSFATVSSWTAPAGSFNWISPVATATAAALDGNAPANSVLGLGGTVATTWGAGDTLWIRWVERNDVGNDHGLAIDNLSFSVSAVPEPEIYALMLAGMGMMGAMARRRRNGV